MNRSAAYFLLIMINFASGCGDASSGPVSPAHSPTPKAAVSPSPAHAPSPQFPANGDYPGTGTVTKLNLEIGSVEMDHDEIKSVMPPMRMEFYVSDKKLLDGFALGDKVSFTLRYKDHTEIIVDIKKTQ